VRNAVTVGEVAILPAATVSLPEDAANCKWRNGSSFCAKRKRQPSEEERRGLQVKYHNQYMQQILTT